MNERILMTFPAKVVNETRNNLEHSRDVAVNPLKPESILLFSGCVIVGNIMEKREKGFSWNFHEISGTTQEIIS